MFDIYFENNYGKLYENAPEEKFKVFEYEDKIGKISNRFIKRKIPLSLNDNITYFDLMTPYGYGGPIIEHLDNVKNLNTLINNYEEQFREYTIEKNIVSEFVRFHPIINNVKHFKKMYNAEFDRYTVGTDLTFEDPFLTEFSKSTRKNIRKLLRNELISYEVEEAPENLRDFMTVYYSTMERNNASKRYYFKEKYFDEIIKNLKEYVVTVKVYYEENVIGMGLYFKYGEYLHTHLSGTLREYLKYSPAYLLRYALMEYGKNNGFKYIHHGGGKTKFEDDSLFKFKKQFGKNTEFKFFVGNKIWNESIYKKMTVLSNNKTEKHYFPAYRKSLER